MGARSSSSRTTELVGGTIYHQDLEDMLAVWQPASGSTCLVGTWLPRTSQLKLHVHSNPHKRHANLRRKYMPYGGPIAMSLRQLH
jgi:hypothetical protein